MKINAVTLQGHGPFHCKPSPSPVRPWTIPPEVPIFFGGHSPVGGRFQNKQVVPEKDGDQTTKPSTSINFLA